MHTYRLIHTYVTMVLPGREQKRKSEWQSEPIYTRTHTNKYISGYGASNSQCPTSSDYQFQPVEIEGTNDPIRMLMSL